MAEHKKTLASQQDGSSKFEVADKKLKMEVEFKCEDMVKYEKQVKSINDEILQTIKDT